MSDLELLERYVRNNARDALDELVRRHVAWVHAVAMRRLGDPQLANDVTQAVFLVLMQKPPRLTGESAVGAWLFRVVCHACSRARRTELRLKNRERAYAMEHQEAAEMTQQQWLELSPHLDRAVESLGREDREALLLRFYQQKTHAEVATAMGISEEAARKRAQRSVARLREILTARGVQVSAIGALAVGLTSYTTPPLSAAVVQSALAVTQGAAASAQVSSIAKGVAFMLAMSKSSTIAAVCLGALLLMGGAVGIIHLTNSSPSPMAATSPPASAPIATPATRQALDWRDRFNQVYRLEDDEAMKVIPPPFIPERLTYYTASEGRQAQLIPRGPDIYVFDWTNGQLKRWGISFSQDSMQTVESALTFALRFRKYEVEAVPEFLHFKISGDWIIRQESTPERRLESLCQLVHQLGGPALHFEQQNLTRPSIVATGRYEYHAPPGDLSSKLNNIHFYRDESELVPGPGMSGGGGHADSLADLMKELGSRLNMPAIDESTGGPQSLGYASHRISDLERMPLGPERDQAIYKLLDNVAAQTNLKISIEPRKVPVWMAMPDAP